VGVQLFLLVRLAASERHFALDLSAPSVQSVQEMEVAVAEVVLQAWLSYHKLA